MTAAPATLVPLDQVAPDLAPLLAAFRAAGAVSLQDLPLREVRANYLKSCKANGLPWQEVAAVDTIECPVEDGSSIGLRLYRGHGIPADKASRVIFFIHGGGWAIGNLDSHDPLCRTLANHTASTVIAVDYRLAPEYKFPTPLNDCRDALAYIVARAAQLELDVSQMVVTGDSAGGNMATVLANRTDYRPAGFLFAGQVLLYPVTDLACTGASYARITSGFPLTAATMHWFRDLYLDADADVGNDLLSPLRAASEQPQPPMFIVTAGLDPLADEGIAYAAKAARAGTRVIHHHLPNHMHGIFTSAGKVETGRTMLEVAARFVRALWQGI